VVTRTQPVPTAEIRAAPAQSLLFKDSIDASFPQRTQWKIGGIEGVTQQDLTGFQQLAYRSERRLLIACLAPPRAYGRIEQRGLAQGIVIVEVFLRSAIPVTRCLIGDSIVCSIRSGSR
jgi:hypothetical protein